MKIALVNSGDSHTQVRLWPFLSHLKAHYYHTPEDFQGGDYNLIFFESNCQTDISPYVRDARLICFDCEDSPSEAKFGPSFRALIDRAEAFAKIVIQTDRPVSKLKEINLPIYNYLWYNEVCGIERSVQQREEPFFIGAPTLITDYDKKYPDSPLLKDGVGSKLSLTDDGSVTYHQRFHWLSDLEKDVPVSGGLTWGGGNLSLEWQSKYFPGIAKFGVERISQVDQIKNCLSHKVCLSPGGMCRWSFRMFDLMATGAPFFSADLDKKMLLYMPDFYAAVKDEDSIKESVSRGLNVNDFKGNREILSKLNPWKVWEKFLKQLN